MKLRKQNRGAAHRGGEDGALPLKFPFLALSFLLVLGMVSSQAGISGERVDLSPRLQVGQTLIYLISYRSERNIKTESNVVIPQAPNGAQMDAHGLLLIEILDVRQEGGKAAVHARSHFQTLDSGVWLKHPDQKKPVWDQQHADPEGKLVEFTILADGRVDEVKGLDTLVPEQQQAWQEWVTQFAVAAVFPSEGVKRGGKWKNEEAEKSPSPIAGLEWSKDSAYVRDEPCRPVQITIQGDVVEAAGAEETCAVILTTASLKQKSSQKDATPEDYKLHELRTTGMAKGKNEIITYISLKTGLVVRATEEAIQAMDVTVAKADGSNRVHYNVDAKSHSEVLLVTETPLNHP